MELSDSNNGLTTVPQGEARHDIGQFGNFRRSRYGDDTLEVAAAPIGHKINNSIFNSAP